MKHVSWPTQHQAIIYTTLVIVFSVVVALVLGLADFLFDAKKNPDIEATGWAVIKDNSQSIAAAVKDILANPEKVKTVTECARRMVLEKYDWDKIAKEMKEKVFSELI